MAEWLDGAFSTAAKAEVIAQAMMTHNAGMAIKHLRLIEKELQPFVALTQA